MVEDGAGGREGGFGGSVVVFVSVFFKDLCVKYFIFYVCYWEIVDF